MPDFQRHGVVVAVGFNCHSASSIEKATSVQLRATASSCTGLDGLPPLELYYEETHLSNWANPFKDLKFRTSQFGTKYSLEGHYEGIPLINIKMSSDAPPDTVKGGNLDGKFSFHRSFLITDPIWVHSSVENRYKLELWNVYTQQKESKNSGSLGKILALNIPFVVGNQTHARLVPVLSALTRLRPSSPLITLPYNYDLSAMFPRRSRFIVYNSTQYPFPHPDAKDEIETDGERCRQPKPISIYLFQEALKVSERDLEMIKEAQKSLQRETDEFSRQRDGWKHRNKSSHHRSMRAPSASKAIVTALKDVILVRRRIARAAALVMPIRSYDGELDPPAFPADCIFLKHIFDGALGKSGAEQVAMNPAVVVICVGSILRYQLQFHGV